MKFDLTKNCDEKFIDSLFKENNYGASGIKYLIENENHLNGLQLRFIPYLYEKFQNEEFDLKFFKDIYELTLTNHQKLLSELSELTERLNRNNVDFVLTKGVAVSLLIYPRPIRIFGDIDILVLKKDVNKFLDLAYELGYRNKFPMKCPKYDWQNSMGEIALFKKDSYEIDVHVIDIFTRSTLKQIFKSGRMAINVNRTEFNVPIPELMICHSLEHGLKKVAQSDALQSSVDLKLLENNVNPKELKKFLKSQHLFSTFYKFRLHEGYKNISHASYVGLIIDRSLFNLRDFLQSFGELFQKLPIVLSKRRSFSELKYVKTLNTNISFLYLIWLALGMNSRLENLFGPFLTCPSNVLENSKVEIKFLDTQVSGYTFMKCSSITCEYRFAFKLIPELARVNIVLSDEKLQGEGFLVFLNGYLYGTTNPVLSSYEIRIDNPSEYYEISLRLPKHSCEDCFTDLSGMQLSFYLTN